MLFVLRSLGNHHLGREQQARDGCGILQRKPRDLRWIENALFEHVAELTGRRVVAVGTLADRKSTRLNSSHSSISYAVFCLKKKTRRCPSAFHPCTVPVKVERGADCSPIASMSKSLSFERTRRVAPWAAHQVNVVSGSSRVV